MNGALPLGSTAADQFATGRTSKPSAPVTDQAATAASKSSPPATETAAVSPPKTAKRKTSRQSSSAQTTSAAAPKAVKFQSMSPRQKKPRSGVSRKGKQSKKHRNKRCLKPTLLSLCLEFLSISVTLLIGVMILLGYAAERFAGIGFFANLLPFASGILGFILAAALLLVGWWKLRAWLNSKTAWLSPALSITLATAIGWLVVQNSFAQAFRYYRTLVGAAAEAERHAIAHQVYAAYRRATPAQLQILIDRAADFTPDIEAAALSFGIDSDLLYGLAATESSFLPRTSTDGGQGLFQITKVPKTVIEHVTDMLGVTEINVLNPKHNAFIAAATLQHYLEEMRGDLFLGLLAYNIGPANGGLRFIMKQYGAKDFVTIQPYLQTLPRDYPIRVLSYALAFRLWHLESKLPAYEEGDNAAHIQSLGIPGFDQST